MMNTEAQPREPLEVLAEEFLARYRRGERPALSDYAQRHPKLAEQIRELFPTLVDLENAGDASRTQPIQQSGGFQCPEQLGDFRIVREIGRGGMGIVFEAEQESLGRRVALKVFPFHALLDPRHLARFQREARAAAQLHHSHIVPVHGVGQCDGLYYYAMQLIDGQSLDQVLRGIAKLAAPVAGAARATVDTLAPTHRDTNPDLPLTASLSRRSGQDFYRRVAQLARQAAEALAYAHDQGIVHRDIKPSNLLLDRLGNIWITDFGLAKHEGPSELTQSGDVIGTLRYMAPEQLQGWADPRTDIHGLGLTIYEVIGLRPANDTSKRGDLIKRIEDCTPLPLLRLDRRVPRDLATIVAKMIAKEPGERYASASEAASDLSRFLADEPIHARPPSAVYRFRKFARRNQASFAAAAIIAVALLLGTGVSLWQAVRARNAEKLAELRLEGEKNQRDVAERNVAEAKRQQQLAEGSYREARQAIDQLFVKLTDDAALNEPELEPLRRGLLQSALQYYEVFIDLWQHDSKKIAELAESYRRVGVLTEKIGANPQALSSYEKAISLNEQLHRIQPSNSELDAALATTYASLAMMQKTTGRYDASRQNFEQAISVWQHLLKQNPAEPTFRNGLASSYYNLGGLLVEVKQSQEAIRYQQLACGIREELVHDHPQSTAFRFELANSYGGVGNRLLEAKQFDEAVAMQQRKLALLDELASEQGARTWLRREIGRVYNNIGDIHRAWRSGPDWAAQALEAYGHAQQVEESLVRDNPKVARLQLGLANTLDNAAEVLFLKRQYQEALHMYDLSLAYSEPLVKRNPNDANYRSYLGSSLGRKGATLDALGRWDEAVTAYEDGIRSHQKLITLAPGVARYQEELDRYQSLLARVCEKAGNRHREQGKYAAAVAAYRKVLELQPENPDILNRVAWLLVIQGTQARDIEYALNLVERACELKPDSPHFLNTLAAAQWRGGRYALALSTAQTVEQRLTGHFTWPHNWLIQALCHAELGQTDMSKALFEKSGRWLESPGETNLAWRQEALLLQQETEALLRERVKTERP